MKTLWYMVAVASVLTGCIQLAYAQNALTNPGFEQGEEGWRTWPRKGEPVFEIDSEVAHSGTSSARIEVDEAGEDGSWCQIIQPEPGRTYEYSLWFRTADPDKQVTFMAEFVAGGGGYLGNVGQRFTCDGTQWTKGSGTFAVSSNTGTVQFEVWVNLDDADVTTAWFDDLVLEVVPPELVLDEIAIEVLQPAHRVVREAGQDVVVRIPWPTDLQAPTDGRVPPHPRAGGRCTGESIRDS